MLLLRIEACNQLCVLLHVVVQHLLGLPTAWRVSLTDYMDFVSAAVVGVAAVLMGLALLLFPARNLGVVVILLLDVVVSVLFVLWPHIVGLLLERR